MTVGTSSPVESPSERDARRGWLLATLLLAVSMFVTGGCGLIYEYVLSTVSTYILGNSVEQFSVIIGLMMFMMAVAGWMQRYVSDHKLVEKFVLIESLLALLGGFAPIAIYAAYGAMEDHFNLILYAMVLAIGFMIGMEIPLAMRINEKYTDSLGTNIASIWSLDYIGSLIGSLLFALWMIKAFAITQISFLIAFANLGVAIASYAFFARKRLITGRLLVPAILSVTLLALLVGNSHNLKWNESLEQKLYESKIVLSMTTRYQRLVMTRDRSTDEYRFYINGNLQFSSADEAIYHEQLVHPVMSLVPDHQRVLVLGGGDGLALRELLKYQDLQQAALVDLDPDMIRLCSTNHVLTGLNHRSFADARVHTSVSPGISDMGCDRVIYQRTGDMIPAKDGRSSQPMVEPIGKVSVFTVDADKFIAVTSGKWNVVIVDLPDPSSIELAKLFSKEFYTKVRRVLAENGMVVVQATSPYHSKEAFLNIRRTLDAAGFATMPYHDNVPSFGDWGWILAWKRGIPEAVVRKRIETMQPFPVSTRYLTPDVFRKALVFGKGWLDSSRNDINTLMHPTILQRYVDEGWKIE